MQRFLFLPPSRQRNRERDGGGGTSKCVSGGLERSLRVSASAKQVAAPPALSRPCRLRRASSSSSPGGSSTAAPARSPLRGSRWREGGREGKARSEPGARRRRRHPLVALLPGLSGHRLRDRCGGGQAAVAPQAAALLSAPFSSAVQRLRRLGAKPRRFPPETPPLPLWRRQPRPSRCQRRPLGYSRGLEVTRLGSQPSASPSPPAPAPPLTEEAPVGLGRWQQRKGAVRRHVGKVRLGGGSLQKLSAVDEVERGRVGPLRSVPGAAPRGFRTTLQREAGLVCAHRRPSGRPWKTSHARNAPSASFSSYSRQPRTCSNNIVKSFLGAPRSPPDVMSERTVAGCTCCCCVLKTWLARF